MKNLALKLLAFQKEVGAVKKDSVNPFYHSKYADINSYIELVKPLLSKYGLVILQPLTSFGEKTALSTIIIDSESGEQIEDTTFLPENTDPQKMGAVITYFRRYAIQSMLCLEAEDDDANSAVEKPEPTTKFSPIPTKKETALKTKIKALCDQLDPILTTKEDYEAFVLKNTGFSLALEQFHPQIIKSLERLIK